MLKGFGNRKQGPGCAHIRGLADSGVNQGVVFIYSVYLEALVTLSEKAMAPHSSTLAWRIPGTGEPGGLPSMGSHRVRHD